MRLQGISQLAQTPRVITKLGAELVPSPRPPRQISTSGLNSERGAISANRFVLAGMAVRNTEWDQERALGMVADDFARHVEAAYQADTGIRPSVYAVVAAAGAGMMEA